MMRRAAPYVALFLALGGTAFAAGPLLTGKDFEDGSLTSADVRDRSLRPSDIGRSETLPRGPRGEPGKAGDVGAPGPPSPREEANLKLVFAGISAQPSSSEAFEFTRPAPGVYCSTFEKPQWVDVNSQSVDTAQRVTAIVTPASIGEPCAAGTTIRVNVFAANGSPADGPFHIVIGTGG